MIYRLQAINERNDNKEFKNENTHGTQIKKYTHTNGVITSEIFHNLELSD